MSRSHPPTCQQPAASSQQPCVRQSMTRQGATVLTAALSRYIVSAAIRVRAPRHRNQRNRPMQHTARSRASQAASIYLHSFSPPCRITSAACGQEGTGRQFQHATWAAKSGGQAGWHASNHHAAKPLRSHLIKRRRKGLWGRASKRRLILPRRCCRRRR